MYAGLGGWLLNTDLSDYPQLLHKKLAAPSAGPADRGLCSTNAARFSTLSSPPTI